MELLLLLENLKHGNNNITFSASSNIIFSSVCSLFEIEICLKH